MRAFIAIDLPEPVLLKLTGIQRALSPMTSSARWVAADSMHLTLKFLGEISIAQIDEVDRAMTGLTWKPFRIDVSGLGFFPGMRSPRILWAGLTAPSMEDLAAKIDTRMERLGIESEKRVFRPHITLARAKEARLDAALVQAVLDFRDADCGSFAVDRCFLFQSTLKPSGAIYNKLKEYALTAERDS